MVMEDDYDNRQEWRARGQCSGGIVKSVHVEPFQRRAEFRCDWLETQCSGAANVQSICRESGFCERRRALKRDRECGSVGGTAKVEEGEWRQQTQRRDDADEENRQDRGEGAVVAAMNRLGEQKQQGYSDCDERNQEPTSPMLGLNHLHAVANCSTTPIFS